MAATPVVLQAEADQCGLACVAMIAAAHGNRTTPSSLRERYAAFDRGPCLHTVLGVAGELGLDARPLRLELDDLGRLALPAILHWQLDHFVVLTKTGRRRAVIHDPAAGRRHVTRDEMSRSFTGVAVELQPSRRFRNDRRHARLSLGSLLSMLDGHRRYLWLMFTLLIVSQLLALALPVGTQLLIDEVLVAADRRSLAALLAGIGALLLAAVILETLRRRYVLDTGINLSIAASLAAVRHVFRLPVPTIETRAVADIVSRIESLLPVQKLLTETLVNGAVQIIALALTVVVMLLYSPLVTLLSVVALCAVGVAQALMLPSIRARDLEAIVATAASDQSLIESIRAFGTVSALGMASARVLHWQTEFRRAGDARGRRGLLMIRAAAIRSIVAAVDQLAFLGIGVLLVGNRQMSIGVLFALFGLRGRLNQAAGALAGVIHELYLAQSHLDRIGDIVALPSTRSAPTAAVRCTLKGAVDCRSLTSRYPGGAPVPDGFSCSIDAGERVVICGPSGAGKSTLLKLFAMELRPTAGTLCFDDYDVRLWDPVVLQAQLAFVRQGDRLMAGSVAANVAGFEACPDVGRIREAAEIACIWDDIVRLPMQLDMPLPSGGHGLSGGQLQRLAIARALYRRPRVLLLDEATNQLDERTEARVINNLAGIGCTIVSVVHSAHGRSLSGRPIWIGPRANGNCRPAPG